MNAIETLKTFSKEVIEKGKVIKAKVKDLTKDDIKMLSFLSTDKNVDDLYIKRSGNGLTIIVETI